ncbi:hypothetical protein JCM33774_53320 [Actinophytocola sp. KF-1]
MAEHLESAGSPTWFARFGAQVMTDPALRPIMVGASEPRPTAPRAREPRGGTPPTDASTDASTDSSACGEHRSRTTPRTADHGDERGPPRDEHRAGVRRVSAPDSV